MAIDDNTTYGLTGAQVKELPEKINAIKGQAKELTAEDYNYPTNNPTCVALWLMEPGLYINKTNALVRVSTTDSSTYNGVYFVATSSGTSKIIFRFGNQNGGANNVLYKTTVSSSGIGSDIVSVTAPVDNLTSNSYSQALSANQGRVLKNLVNSIAIRGTGAPTTSTVGQVGTLYEDTTNGKLYICTDATNPYVWTEVGAGGGGSGVVELTSADYNYDDGNTGTNNTVGLWLLDDGVYVSKGAVKAGTTVSSIMNDTTGYIWIVNHISGGNSKIFQISDGGRIIHYTVVTATGAMNNHIYELNRGDIVGNTGTSQTDVMSQNATTSMVFADPGTRRKIRIGADSSVGGANGVAIGYGANANSSSNNSVAIGNSANVEGAPGGIALGAYSRVAINGQMNIGTTDVSYGYNNSNYRLLSGLYDPQSAHDAATKGYVDGMITLTDTDPGEGAALAAGKFIAVYDSNS